MPVETTTTPERPGAWARNGRNGQRWSRAETWMHVGSGPRVAHLMSRPVHRLERTATLHEAARLMWEHDIGALPVVGDGGRVIGLVTDRDVAMAAYLNGRRLEDIPVEQVMARQVTCVRAHEPLSRASALMARRQVHRLPVLDEAGALVGMLSLNDLAGSSADPTSDGITEHEVLHVLRAVTAPRALTPRNGLEPVGEA